MDKEEPERKSLEGMRGPGDVEYDAGGFVIDKRTGNHIQIRLF